MRRIAIAVIAGNGPTAELGERLAAEARTARAEEHEGPRIFRQRGKRFARGIDVVAPLRHAQQGKRFARMVLA